ncbi:MULTISPECIES: HD family phosphohydrolase [unclassified Tychonema]|uniref:HD family phosphohydrolase n=1 Tax=unclassified Tychonema TaxID=2642144 RepID=UPI001D13324E|nr:MULTISPECIES: HDIG domain-containing metalloprotein [unclassified Tychonema]
MNTISSLMRQIEQLGAARSLRQQIAKVQNGSKAEPDRPGKHLLSRFSLDKLDLPETFIKFRSKTSKSTIKNQARSPMLVIVAVVSLTSTLGHRFYNQPKLDVGTKAPQTIQAPASASIPDRKTTEEERSSARIGAVAILMLDPAVEQQIDREMQLFWQQGSELRREVGSFPFAATSALSNSTQLYLRRCPEWEWRSILAGAGDSSGATSEKLNLDSPASDAPTDSQSKQEALTQLQAYSRSVSAAEFKSLTDSISSARIHYASAVEALEKPSVSGLRQIYDTSLFDLSDAAWQKTQTGMSRVAKIMLAQGIPPGLPKEMLKEAVKLQIADEVPLESQALAVEGLSAILQPNLVKDPEATKQLAELAAQKVKPVTIAVKQGDIIVTEGKEISQQDFVLLDYFGLSRRGVNWLGLAGFVCLVSGAIAIVLLVERHYRLRRRDHLLLLLLTLSAPVLVSLGLPWTSLPAIGILAGGFYGSAVGVTVVGLLSALLPVGLNVELIHLVASAAGGLLGAFMAGRLRSREELALLGVAVGLTQGSVYLVGTLIASAAAGAIWYLVLGTVGAQSLAGLAWSVVAIGISPYLEHVFDLITPIRLAELANPNRPLLKKLAAEAPGTFQHTLFVASLAEAAARELGCNVELVRTGTLYHDIGKMHDPLGFCENQMGGGNKHDEINDPWKSAEIIKKHVSEGLLMARKHRLPKAIQAFIPEHQGTMLIAYFYHQAKQDAAQKPEDLKMALADADNSKLAIAIREVTEKDFRYVGPIPQSRETGILMLADSCEAALRSLKDATHEEALNMVNKILRARWQDNQLLDSGLTREDMSLIAEIFVRVWEQFNHKRIAYPSAVFTPR